MTLSLITGSYRLWGTRSAFISTKKQAAALTRLHTKNAKRFKNAALVHGGAFLKVGQLISARSDVMPAIWVQELQALEDQAKLVPFQEIKDLLDTELKQPIVAASIGQAHQASLMSGEQVAVKVQAPSRA